MKFKQINGLLIYTIESMGKYCDTLAVQCNISSVCWNLAL